MKVYRNNPEINKNQNHLGDKIMAIKIRLSRGGSKKRPFYRIVATDSRMPRDGRFIEKLGTYNPLLPKDSQDRINMNIERVKHWLNLGAQATDRVQRMLEASDILPKKKRSNPKKAIAGKAAQERLKEKSEKEVTAKEVPTPKEPEEITAAAPSPTETTEAPAEDKPTETTEAPAEDKPTETTEAPAEDKPTEDAK